MTTIENIAIDYTQWINETPCDPAMAAALIMGKDPMDLKVLSPRRDVMGKINGVDIWDEEISHVVRVLTNHRIFDQVMSYTPTTQKFSLFYYVNQAIKNKISVVKELLLEIKTYYISYIDEDKKQFQNDYAYLARELELPSEVSKNKNQNKSLTATQKERNSMLKMILGMAMDKYNYSPSAINNSATGSGYQSIKAGLDKQGLGLDEDTIRKILKEASETYHEDLN